MSSTVLGFCFGEQASSHRANPPSCQLDMLAVTFGSRRPERPRARNFDVVALHAPCAETKTNEVSVNPQSSLPRASQRVSSARLPGPGSGPTNWQLTIGGKQHRPHVGAHYAKNAWNGANFDSIKKFLVRQAVP